MKDESKPMCRAGCGFNADPATDGLCSLCFNKNTETSKKNLATNCQPIPIVHAAKSFSNPSSCLNRVASTTFVESNMAVALVEAERHELLESNRLQNSPLPQNQMNSNSSHTPQTTMMLKKTKNYVVDLQINLKSNSEHIQKISTGNQLKKNCETDAESLRNNFNATSSSSSSSNSSSEIENEKNNVSISVSGGKRSVRCAAKNCRRKLSLTDFQCRCGRCFCPLHRYSDRHDCTFNYREWGASEIQRKNPRVVGEKIRKI